VLDSKSASLGQGLLAVKAAKARDAGKTLDEIAAYIEGEITHTHFWIMADDLHHLKRGGRISGTKAVIGTMLNVKPILTIANTGKLMSFTKARGRNKALTMFMEQMDKYKCRKGETVYIAHSDVPEAAEQLKELLAERGETDIIVNTIGPVIGAHTGPGTIAIVFSGDGERELEQ
jgi:DegV family protein with EDD domain